MAARLYYLDGLPQAEVARMVKVSQAKVSRLLALARQRGVVRISVAEYEPRNKELEEALCREFKLSAAVVIKTIPGAGVEEARHAVGYFGATILADMVPRHSTVAIAGGRTMRELILSWPENRELGITVVQAMGSIDFTSVPADALELGRTLARKSGGFLVTLNTPAMVADKRTRDSFMAHEQIRGAFQRLRETDIALVGIGTLENSVFVDRDVLKPADQAAMRDCGAVGEICGRFFDNAGNECHSIWRDRVISIALPVLRQTPLVVGVTVGTDRADAVRAAIRGGLLKALLLDEVAAFAILGRTCPEANRPGVRAQRTLRLAESHAVQARHGQI